MKRIELTEDYNIARILRGCWQLSDGHLIGGQVDSDAAAHDLHPFIQAGMTTLDVADIYTGAEEIIGTYRQLYPESQVQVHTKYVPNRDALATVKFTDTELIIDRSLERLKLQSLDLVQYHWWDYDVPRYVEVANHLKTLQEKGKIRHIGVTNFSASVLREIIESGVHVLTTQNQYSVLDSRVEGAMTSLCQEHGVKILCYGTLAGGFLSEKWLGQPEPDITNLENRSLIKYKLVIDDTGGWDTFQNLLHGLKEIGDKHGVSLSEVASGYMLTRPHVAGVIVGARNANHIARTRRISDLALDNQDLMKIKALRESLSPLSGEVFQLERDDPRHTGIMKTNLN